MVVVITWQKQLLNLKKETKVKIEKTVNQEHGELVARLIKPATQIATEIKPEDVTVISSVSLLIQAVSTVLSDTSIACFAQENPPVEYINDLHCLTGAVGELGEVLDEIKKHVFNRKELNVDNLRKEIGDALFYARATTDSYLYEQLLVSEQLALLLSYTGLTIEEILRANITKLNKRYESGSYSDKQAQLKKDKA